MSRLQEKYQNELMGELHAVKKAVKPEHVFLVVDVASGDVVRADGPRKAEREPAPAGRAARVLLAMAGLDEGSWTPQFNYWQRPAQMDDGGANLVD